MKVLFVCNENVSRSQMAAAIYNHLTKTHDADAAGINVDVAGESLGERWKRVGTSTSFELMKESGLDMSTRVRKQLNQAMLKDYDMIISMQDVSISPDWLKDQPHYLYWHMPDPKGKGMEATRATKDEITKRIKELIDS